jgi:hypothetical protein
MAKPKKRVCPERARGGMNPIMTGKRGECLIVVAAAALACQTEHE